jgi:7-cyano-7-deazaguanine synthase
VNTLVVCSGGLDSVTLAHKVAVEQRLIHLVSFDYGQRHRKELEFARACAARLGVAHDVADITDIGRRLTGSVLADGAARPDGHAEETMWLTVVRLGVAMARRAEAVAAVMNGGNHFIYPRLPPTVRRCPRHDAAFRARRPCAMAFATSFLRWGKADIVREGVRLGVPFSETWSCYKGGAHHCGRCGTCVERREAFHLAGVDDPTAYDDPDYWREARGAYFG